MESPDPSEGRAASEGVSDQPAPRLLPLLTKRGCLPCDARDCPPPRPEHQQRSPRHRPRPTPQQAGSFTQANGDFIQPVARQTRRQHSTSAGIGQQVKGSSALSEIPHHPAVCHSPSFSRYVAQQTAAGAVAADPAFLQCSIPSSLSLPLCSRSDSAAGSASCQTKEAGTGSAPVWSRPVQDEALQQLLRPGSEPPVDIRGSFRAERSLCS